MQMLKNWNPEQIPEKEDIKVRLSAARTRLYELLRGELSLIPPQISQAP